MDGWVRVVEDQVQRRRGIAQQVVDRAEHRRARLDLVKIVEDGHMMRCTESGEPLNQEAQDVLDVRCHVATLLDRCRRDVAADASGAADSPDQVEQEDSDILVRRPERIPAPGCRRLGERARQQRRLAVSRAGTDHRRSVIVRSLERRAERRRGTRPVARCGSCSFVGVNGIRSDTDGPPATPAVASEVVAYPAES